MGAVRELPRIATIATMPSRVQSFAKVMADIHAQVDHTFVYLDGHAAPPAFLDAMDRVTVLHGEALGNLHSSSRFLLLRDLPGPAVVCSIDDDIAYPPDYTDRLVDVLDKLDGQAIPSSRINPPDIEIGEHLTVNGIAGCNRYFGQGHLEDDRLWVTSLGNTEMACLAPLDAVEQAVLTTLTEGATLSGTPQTLILTGKQHRLEYRLRDWVY